MKCFIGLGSNQGDRRNILEQAAQKLKALSVGGTIKLSPIYESAPLVPKDAPAEWSELSFFNAVAQLEWRGTPPELLAQLKKIEKELGRESAPRWAPRRIDLDLLIFGDESFESDNLVIPHPEIQNRSFVLDPLRDLASTHLISSATPPVSVLARQLKSHRPLIMGVINCTPDSFSDGGENNEVESIAAKIQKMDELNIPLIDLGAESTRPQAQLVSAQEEWSRLEPALQEVQNNVQGRLFRLWLSLDTYKPEIAERALASGAVQIINDVNGLADPKMLGLVQESGCDFVFMHSLTVPANPEVCLPAHVDPVAELKSWLKNKLNLFESQRINLDRAIFDPGIGFGKTAFQSITLLRRMEEFKEFPIRILVGHSRKSFMKVWNIRDPKKRDGATLGVSLALQNKGVDILRVHDFENHKIAMHSFQEVLQ